MESYSGLEYKSKPSSLSPMPKFFRSTEHKHLQDLMREIRLNAGLKQSELAEKLGQSQSYVSKYESGERVLDLLEVRYICAVLQISFADFANELEKRINEA